MTRPRVATALVAPLGGGVNLVFERRSYLRSGAPSGRDLPAAATTCVNESHRDGMRDAKNSDRRSTEPCTHLGELLFELAHFLDEFGQVLRSGVDALEFRVRHGGRPEHERTRRHVLGDT